MYAFVKSANLALAFLLELALLGVFAIWGFRTGDNLVVKLLLGIGVPVLVAGFWGMFMAPKASRRLQGAAYLVAKIGLFGLAVAALVVAGSTTLGVLLGAVFAINTVLLYALR